MFFLGLFILVMSGFIIIEVQSQLSDISQTVETASSIPFVGWITGPVTNYSYSQAKEELEFFRYLGIGGAVLGLGLFLFYGPMYPGKKKEKNKVVESPQQISRDQQTGVRVCLQCGFQNSDQIKFCGDCGTELVRPGRACDDRDSRNSGH